MRESIGSTEFEKIFDHIIELVEIITTTYGSIFVNLVLDVKEKKFTNNKCKIKTFVR